MNITFPDSGTMDEVVVCVYQLIVAIADTYVNIREVCFIACCRLILFELLAKIMWVDLSTTSVIFGDVGDATLTCTVRDSEVAAALMKSNFLPVRQKNANKIAC